MIMTRECAGCQPLARMRDQLATKKTHGYARPGERFMPKSKFVIAPHMRLHEWVAEEKGYFEDEGLEYEFSEALKSRLVQLKPKA